MKIGMVNKSTTVNRFVLHTLQRNIMHLAVITRTANIKLGILKGRKLEKSQKKTFKIDLQILSLIKIKMGTGKELRLVAFYNQMRALFPPPPPHTNMNFTVYGVTSDFTRFVMRTKYVFQSLISPYVNFHNN